MYIGFGSQPFWGEVLFLKGIFAFLPTVNVALIMRISICPVKAVATVVPRSLLLFSFFHF